MREARWRWAALALAVSAALAPLAPALAAKGEVEIRNSAFSPDPIRIRAGESVRWKNLDGVAHRLVGNDFDSGLLETGQAYTHTFKEAGDFSYLCVVHWWLMRGVVQVDSAPPSSVPPTTARATTTTVRRATTTTRPTGTTAKPTTTTKPAAAKPTTTTRPTATTARPTGTTGISVMAAPPPGGTATGSGSGPTTTTTAAALSGPAPPGPPAQSPPPPAGARRSTSSTSSPAPASTAAPDPATGTPGEPVPVAADSPTLDLPPGEAGDVAGDELARGLIEAPPLDTHDSTGGSLGRILSLATLFGVGGFGAWSLVQLRPGRPRP